MIRAFEHHQPQLGGAVYVDQSAVVIGRVTLGDDASIWPGAVLRGDVNRISVGARSNIQDGSVCHVTHDGPYTPGGIALSIGEDVTVGHRVILHACVIQGPCLVGMGSVVMDGAVVEAGSIIAAGSLVPPNKTLPGGHLYRGSPAKAVRALSGEETDMLGYSAAHYVALKNRYLGQNA